MTTRRPTRSNDDPPVAVVTGGFGFIGSCLVKQLVRQNFFVVNVDVQTYASSPDRLSGISGDRLENVHIDVCSTGLNQLLSRWNPRVVFHLAAESHVTRSESAPELFYRSNVEGTDNVINASLAAGVDRIVHVSTDEVYGPCLSGSFDEGDKMPGDAQATSAYAKSKSLADDVAVAAMASASVTVLRLSNCYGPGQHPEKAVARWTIRALNDEPIPLWGGGEQEREWMFVEDACEAMILAMNKGDPGMIYNVSPEQALTNHQLAQKISRLAGGGRVHLTSYDRPQHDRRYAISAERMRRLGWSARTSLDDGLAMTVDWYRRNEAWWAPLVDEAERIYADAKEDA